MHIWSIYDITMQVSKCGLNTAIPRHLTFASCHDKLCHHWSADWLQCKSGFCLLDTFVLGHCSEYSDVQLYTRQFCMHAVRRLSLQVGIQVCIMKDNAILHSITQLEEHVVMSVPDAHMLCQHNYGLNCGIHRSRVNPTSNTHGQA